MLEEFGQTINLLLAKLEFGQVIVADEPPDKVAITRDRLDTDCEITPIPEPLPTMSRPYNTDN